MKNDFDIIFMIMTLIQFITMLDFLSMLDFRLYYRTISYLCKTIKIRIEH